MRLKSVTIKDFKRFTDLTVEGIPETARLIVLAGPNGCGKSSFFDALNTWHGWCTWEKPIWQPDYHGKTGSPQREEWAPELVDVQWHNFRPEKIIRPEKIKKALYFRSAYRNDPQPYVESLGRQEHSLEYLRMIDNDAAVSRNYQRLVSKGLEDLYEKKDGQTTFENYRKESIGDIREALLRLFPGLELNTLGSPLEDGTFRFTKGTSNGFAFKNLSGGEKAVFDLTLDLVVARRNYDDTVFCIDEPEAHMNARLQAEFLSVLYGLIPQGCQMMLATHSIGMMRRARDIEKDNPGSVVFLDFGDYNFDEKQKISPMLPDRAFWDKAYRVALDDIAALVAPERVIICEGEPKNGNTRNHSHDARCYEKIFETEFPDTKFVPGGSNSEVIDDRRGIAYALGLLIKGLKVVRLIDRDDRSPQEVKEVTDGRQGPIRILSRRNIESYLFDNEVLVSLAKSVGKDEKVGDLLAKKKSILQSQTNNLPDDLKPASGKIYCSCKEILGLTQSGNDVRAFMRDTLAPLVNPEMDVYKALKQDIFGQ